MSSLASTDDVETSEQGAHAAELVRLRPVSIDDWSDVRYVHGSAFRTIIGPRVAPRDLDYFMETLGAPEYVDRLSTSELTGAWLAGDLAGTVGWRPAANGGHVARIEGLFVRPLFTFMGLGSLLLAHAEARARHAGYSAITALATSVSVPFFMRSGYDIYAQGVGVSDFPSDMPVFLMRKQEDATAVRANGSGAWSWRQSASAEEGSEGLVFRMTPSPDGLLIED